MKRTFWTIRIAFLLCLVPPVGIAFGATIRVPADRPAIQAGIDAASDGDLVLVAAGTYVENIDLLGKAITVLSEAGSEETVIDGDRDGSVVTFATGEAEGTVIDGFTLRNGSGNEDPFSGGDSGGGIYCYGASPTIRKCMIIDNNAYIGGGVYFFDSSALIEDCSIIGNIGDHCSVGYGGGIRCREASPTIRRCTISGNSTEGEGGGISISLSDPTITDCNITHNSSDEAGGGILLWYSDPTIEDCTITGNRAVGVGGGIKGYRSSPAIRRCTISENRSEDDGGGCFFFSFCYATIEDCTITRNQVYNESITRHGGGLKLSGTSDALVTNCTISENSSNHLGGGIAIWEASPTITNCTISGNSAGEYGGGIYCYGLLFFPTIMNCTIIGNSASWGGGLNIRFTTATVTSCTISENTAEYGGGISCRKQSITTMTDCIVWGNSALEGPEIGIVEDSDLTVNYSDVQGGEAGVYVEVGSMLSWLEGNIDTDPLFIGEGYSLGIASPCIDAGDPDPLSDDECFPPSMGAERADMGAYGGPGACEWCGDHDGDGYNAGACGGPDCDDTDRDVYPGAGEICDGKDSDCDGTLPAGEANEDGDVWMICEGDCDDVDPELNPGAREICDNGIDEDCDGLVDGEDPDCITKFTLDLYEFIFAGGDDLIQRYTLGAQEPALWATLLILTSPTVMVIPLWTVPIPVIDPPDCFMIHFPFPSVGWVGIYTGLYTEEGARAIDMAWVDTG